MKRLDSVLNALVREAKFMMQTPTVLIWAMVILCLSSVSIWSGLVEVRHQNQSIERLIEVDQEDRLAAFSKQKDWGSAAYYSFHLTYALPSKFAFASLGQRDSAPWKHRIRMLALEGQVYEHDAGNPALSVIGRFDFTFFAAFVLPLILIVLLHDLRASERVAGRYNLLMVTAGDSHSLWITRASLRLATVFVSAIIPLIVGSLISGTAFVSFLSASALILGYLVFWSLICFWVASWQQSASVILASLIGVWVLLGTIIPAGGRMAIERIVPIPSGTDILMTQREAVNDAWDLPKEDTMQPFLEGHPEWVNTPKIEGPWHWKWYYAFQQVGDQKTESLSNSYRQGRIERDRLSAIVAFVAPPALLERSLQNLAATDAAATLVYEDSVRDFHAQLRSFYYPGLFGDERFDVSAIDRLPVFSSD